MTKRLYNILVEASHYFICRPPFRKSLAVAVLSLFAAQANADMPANLNADMYAAALTAKASADTKIENSRYMVIIDYRRHSSEPRFHLIDLTEDTTESFLVAHGRGSDLNHDGIADTFSNTPDSKMTSLGAFVTGETYYGRHGLSLRLHGLDPENSNAEKRAIVIHGADYVAPGRRVLGRSWGCPSLEHSVAERLIPLIKEGVFVMAVGA